MPPATKKPRRYCRVQGCNKIVKSQGVCQAHGAKTRKCQVADCSKQAQGNFDGMCKYHFKESRVDLKATEVVPEQEPEQIPHSVYDDVIPASLSFVPKNEADIMPLVAHLKHGFDTNRPRGWHRNDERRARGLDVANSAMQLQGWERELVWLEICLLSGIPEASFRHLARAWGRDKGFHMVLAQFICERRGNVERKKRHKSKASSRPRKVKKNSAPEDHHHDEVFFGDLLDLDDLHLPIFALDHHHSYQDASRAQAYVDALDEHLLMPAAAAASLPVSGAAAYAPSAVAAAAVGNIAAAQNIATVQNIATAQNIAAAQDIAAAQNIAAAQDIAAAQNIAAAQSLAPGVAYAAAGGINSNHPYAINNEPYAATLNSTEAVQAYAALKDAEAYAQQQQL